MRKIKKLLIYMLSFLVVFSIFNLNVKATNEETDELIINDSQVGDGFNQFNFMGNWGESKGYPDRFYGGDEHWFNFQRYTQGDPLPSYEIKFKGTGIELYAEKQPGLGIYNIYLDGEKIDTVDAYSANRVSSDKIYSKTDIEYGVHILKVELSNTKNDASSACDGEIDYAKVINPGQVEYENLFDRTDLDVWDKALTYNGKKLYDPSRYDNMFTTHKIDVKQGDVISWGLFGKDEYVLEVYGPNDSFLKRVLSAEIEVKEQSTTVIGVDNKTYTEAIASYEIEDANAKYVRILGNISTKDKFMVFKNLKNGLMDWPDEYIAFDKEEKSILDGKSALFVGDSITNAVKDPDRPYYGWAGRIGIANNMDWKNAGISSATISTALASSYPENRVVNQLEQGREYDYVILHGGMNDSIAMTEIGEMTDSYNLEDFDISTFSGAMDELIYTAKQKYPNAIIGYIVNYATPNSTWGGYSSNNKAYFDRAKEICEKWDIPYIDLYDGGIEEDSVYKSYSYDILEVTSGKNMYDGLSTEIHIGSKGYDIISPYIQKWMEEISLEKDDVLKVTFDDETATDTSGNENNGIIYGDIKYVNGVKGKAIHIDNTDSSATRQYVNFGKPDDLQFGSDDFTIMFWYKKAAYSSGDQVIISNKDWGSGSNPGYLIADYNNAMMLNFTAQGNSRADIDGNPKACDLMWHHIAAVYDRDGEMSFYIDGNKAASKDVSIQASSSIDALDLVLGADGNGQYPVQNCYIDELEIYRDVFTDAEIEKLTADALLKQKTTELQNKITEYENLANIAISTKESKNNFLVTVLNIKEAAQEAKDLSTLEKLLNQLETARNNFAVGLEMLYDLDEIPMTFETWIKFDENQQGTQNVLVGNYSEYTYPDIPMLNLEVTSNGQPRLYLETNGNTTDYVATDVNLYTGKWIHLAITIQDDLQQDGNLIFTTYINGNQVHSESKQGALAKQDQQLTIGADTRESMYMHGAMADLRIWSTTRTADEIHENMNTEVASDEKGLLGNWLLNKDQENGYKDRSPHHNDAVGCWIDEDLFHKAKDGYKTIAVIPDTQTLTLLKPASYQKLTQWLADNKDELGIEFAIHVGDIVNDREVPSQWDVAVSSMAKLENANIPFVFSPGNHDTNIQKIDGIWYGVRNTSMMNSYFPYNKYSKAPSFGGAYKEGEMDNTYSYFTVNNIEFMIISLEQNPRDEVIDWANKVAEENPDKRIIVSTHEYLFVDGKRTTENTMETLSYIGGSNQGEMLWEKFVKKHKNIVSVICGHVEYPDVLNTQAVGNNGNVVQQILCDAQLTDKYDINENGNDGLGMVMLLSFKEGSNDVAVNYYSTVKEKFYRYSNQFSIEMELLDEQTEVDSDKTTLQIAVDLADQVTEKDLENVVPVVVEEFKAALQEAKEILADESASQEDVNASFDRLASVMQKLEFFKGDKTALKAFIDDVSGLDSTKYTETTWAAFETKLNEAIAVYNDENAMQEEVNNAHKELVTAFLNLRLIPDKSLLEELINKAEGLSAANYTKASFDGLTKALNDAKVVFDNPDASQVEVDNAKDVLIKALAKLQTVTTNNTVKTPVNNGDTTTSVKTGDESLTGMFATIALLSVAGYTMLKRKLI